MKLSGQHTGAIFGSIFVEYLKKYGITTSLSSITADNTSTNSTMARSIAAHPDVNFDAETQLFGCIAHVLDLAARDGLALFGVVDEPEEKELLMNAMDLSNIVQPPDGSAIDLSSITRQIHGLVVYVRSSPQRFEAFASTVRIIRSLDTQTETTEPVIHTNNDTDLHSSALQDILHDTSDGEDPSDTTVHKSRDTAVKLVIDVKTCWNSTYIMFQGVLRLRSAVTTFCERSNCKRFALSNIEWDQLDQLWQFLEHLCDATNEMCKTKYPTMHNMIPMYMSVMKGLKRVSILESPL